MRSILLIIICAGLAFAGGLWLGKRQGSHVTDQSAGTIAENNTPAQGRFRKARPTGIESQIDPETLEHVGAIGYLQGYEAAPNGVSVTAHDKQNAFQGLNLYVSGHAPGAFLINMEGDLLYEWQLPLGDVWPGPLGFMEMDENKTYWRRAHLFDNGDVLAIFEGIGMIKVDKNSKLLWAHKGRCHHAVNVTDDGTIYTLARHRRTDFEELGFEGPILEDFILELGADGEERRRISILKAFLDSEYAPLVHAATKRRGDIFHSNGIEWIDGRHAERYPMLRKGHILISVLKLNTIAVIDPEAGRVTWALSGLWREQHDPTVLDDGRIMVFDNLGNGGKSRILVVDPLTQSVAWSYRGDAENPFATICCGTNRRLPNGNTLITESDSGRAFEVTPEHDIVWEFWNPHRAGKDDELIATLFDVIRIPPDRIGVSADGRDVVFR